MRKRIKVKSAELVSTTVVGKNWELKQSQKQGKQLPVKLRNALASFTSIGKNYDESRSVWEGTLC
jgi:hypothetical protein